jgi:hypothetical protein
MASTDTKFYPLNFLPGFHRESTKYSEEGKWYDGNRVRFREGKPENIRGYQKFSNDVISGIPRDLITWADNDTRKYNAFGTNTQLYVTQNDIRYDVTPITTAVSVANNFDTTLNSTNVRVSVSFSHGRATDDRVIFEGVDTFSGTSVNGLRVITSVSGTGVFYVSAANSATSTASNVGGTNGTISFLLKNQESDAIQGLGYGAGVYNAGAVSITGVRAWNEEAASSNITFQSAQWTLDTFGEDLLAQRRGGGLYVVDIDASVVPVRAVATSAPIGNTFTVSPNDRHIVCYGTQTSAQDTISPMYIRWSDQNNYNEWTPSATNTAGDVFLTEGSRIVGVHRSRNAINIWTDRAMYVQEFVGTPFIFRFTQTGSNCGLIAPHAAQDVDGVSYWMGDNNFYMYDGRVQTMECPIRRYLFDSFNMTNKDKVYAGINSEFKEIIWLYPLEGSSEPNGYIIYNYQEQTWVYGKLFEDGIVTTFADRNVFDSTLTTGYVSAADNVYLFDNEPSGVYTGDDQPLSSFLESSTFDLEEGKQLMFADKIIPDYSFSTGENIEFYITTRDYPAGQDVEKGPFIIDQNTNKVNFRARGRQATVKVSATNSGFWRWGSLRIAMQPDGER